jgi:hypothetical protein
MTPVRVAPDGTEEWPLLPIRGATSINNRMDPSNMSEADVEKILSDPEVVHTLIPRADTRVSQFHDEPDSESTSSFARS